MKTLNIVNISGSLILLVYQLIHLYFYSNNFRKRFRNFSKKIVQLSKEKAKEDIGALNTKIKTKDIAFDEIIKISKKLANNLENSKEKARSYLDIYSRIKLFYLFSIGSIFFSILSYKITKIGEYFSSDIGFWLLILSILILLWIILDLCKLEERMIGLEFGIPIEERIEEVEE